MSVVCTECIQYVLTCLILESILSRQPVPSMMKAGARAPGVEVHRRARVVAAAAFCRRVWTERSPCRNYSGTDSTCHLCSDRTEDRGGRFCAVRFGCAHLHGAR